VKATFNILYMRSHRWRECPPRRTSQRRWIYAAGYKIAWESRRFWEQENNIYGGISWLSTGPISLEASILANVWYPSGRMLSEKGVLVAGYGTQSGEFGRLASMEAKFAASRAAVEKLHPGRGKELTKPIYVAWAKIPFTLGSWIGRDGYHEGPIRSSSLPTTASISRAIIVVT
jgi:monoamine oxidase